MVQIVPVDEEGVAEGNNKSPHLGSPDESSESDSDSSDEEDDEDLHVPGDEGLITGVKAVRKLSVALVRRGSMRNSVKYLVSLTGDKPLNEELINCSNYFIKELDNLKNLKVIVTLGRVAFENCLKIHKKKFNINKKFEFKHGKKYLLPDDRVLIACYHPSPRIVNTKVITPMMINKLFRSAKKIARF